MQSTHMNTVLYSNKAAGARTAVPNDREKQSNYDLFSFSYADS